MRALLIPQLEMTTTFVASGKPATGLTSRCMGPPTAMEKSIAKGICICKKAGWLAEEGQASIVQDDSEDLPFGLNYRRTTHSS